MAKIIKLLTANISIDYYNLLAHQDKSIFNIILAAIVLLNEKLNALNDGTPIPLTDGTLL